MSQDKPRDKADEYAISSDAASTVLVYVHNEHIKARQSLFHASGLSIFPLAWIAPEPGSVPTRKIFDPRFYIVGIAMFFSALLLCLYWVSFVQSTPAATSLTAEGWSWKTQLAVNQLQDWYDPDTGLWKTTNWWNAANILTMLGDYALVNPAFKFHFADIAQTTFSKAPSFKVQTLKVITPNGMESYTAPNIPAGMEAPPRSNADDGFLNYYYDDEGWWALAWLKAYDVTNETVYLKEAIAIFNDMTKGYDATCGGIWWNKGHDANVAISNELFLAVAASIANRQRQGSLAQKYYIAWTARQLDWFLKSGLINPDGNINDGINLKTCKNNNGTIWSYNQGVILGAMIEANKADPKSLYRYNVLRIAKAALSKLQDKNGIIHDVCEPNCGADGPQFKGIFMRNLQALRGFLTEKDFKQFSIAIGMNAASIWAKDRDQASLGLVWSGPYQEATAATQSSALDELVAAMDAEMHTPRLK